MFSVWDYHLYPYRQACLRPGILNDGDINISEMITMCKRRSSISKTRVLKNIESTKIGLTTTENATIQHFYSKYKDFNMTKLYF